MSDDIFDTTAPAAITPDDIRRQIAQSSDPTSYDIRRKLAEVLEQGFTEDAVKAVKKKFDDILYDIETDIEYGLKERLSSSLADFICNMADKAIKELLAGNADRMRDYLSAQDGHWTGRDREHSVIHGKLFESDPIALRKRIVETHADLLKSERILDLEAQLHSLVGQVNKLEASNRRLGEELADYRRNT